MMKETDKRCGTCRWWKPAPNPRWWKPAPNTEVYGCCWVPVPEWMPENIRLAHHERNRVEGTTCYYWEAEDEV